MKDVVMQFPNYNNSSLYNGRGHFIVPIDAVKIGNTNVYVFEYDDLNSKKRSRALVQKTARGLSHIPLINKTGLNQLFEENVSRRVSLKTFMDGITNIGVTKMYRDLPTFMEILHKEKQAIVNNTNDIAMAAVNGRRKIMSGIATADVVVHEDLADKYSAGRRTAAAAEAQTKKEEAAKPAAPVVDNSKGDLGFWSTNPRVALGPGRQSGFGSPFGIRTGGMMGPPPPQGVPQVDPTPVNDAPVEDAPQGPRL